MNLTQRTDPIRSVVVGLGRIGYKFHVPAILGHPGYRLVGVADPLKDRVSEVASSTSVHGYDSLEAMLTAEKPELVVIASPTRFHVEQACLSYRHGANVFCDKPVATSVADFDLIVQAAHDAQKKFLAYQPARLKPEVTTLQQLLARGVIGKIHLIKRARCNFERRRDWQAFKANGGGMLNNYGSHCLDEMLALCPDDPIETVFCQTRCVATAGDAEDVVKATLVSGKGCLFDLDISQACALPGPSWQVVGAKGAASFDMTTNTWRIRYYRDEEAPILRAQKGLAAEGRTYGTEQLTWHDETLELGNGADPDYYEAAWQFFREDAAPPVTRAESRQLLALIERCRQSAETGVCT